MYSDFRFWKRIRTRVLERGQSIRGVAVNEGISRNTVRKRLCYERPPGYRHAGREDGQHVTKSPQVRRHIPSPHCTDKQWVGSREGAKSTRTECSRLRWMNLLYDVERCSLRPAAGVDPQVHATLMLSLTNATPACRRKVLSILGNAAGFSSREIAHHLAICRNSVRRYVALFRAGGTDVLFARKRRTCLVDDEELRNALFALLHEPPSASGINRTSWKLDDLRDLLQTRGHCVSKCTISKIVRNAGYRWRSAKVVLTSTDAHYEEKLGHIKNILRNLKPDERFFSIDEFGPFAVKMKPGRLLLEPGARPTVPQWQKSKGTCPAFCV